jgi:hypothetical protein
MAIQKFMVSVTDKETTVEVYWSRWSYDGEVRVDGNVVRRWDKGKWVPRRVEFEICGEKATIHRTGWLVEKWLLIVNDEKHK